MRQCRNQFAQQAISTRKQPQADPHAQQIPYLYKKKDGKKKDEKRYQR
jgi:hypothetical protein